MNSLIPTIVRVNLNNVAEVYAAAKEDNHDLAAPTHIIRREDDIIGCLSVGSVPIVTVWMHTQKAKVRDSLFVESFYEEILNHNFLPQGGVFYLPVNSKSPYVSFLPKHGYIQTPVDMLFIKQLKSIL